MTINKAALSTLRAAKQKQIDQRNPVNKIIEMINYFHSIDTMDATSMEKELAKVELKEMIHKKTLDFSPSLRKRIANGLKNKNTWEMIRHDF